MLVLGIDVIILAAFGAALVVAAYVAALLVPLSRESGVTAVVTATIVSTVMVVAYMLMARALDALL